jgi:hypothetical protein
MKITITGSLGHISKPLTDELIRNGYKLLEEDESKEIYFIVISKLIFPAHL